VTGSTALGEQLDPESLRRVMARFLDLRADAFADLGEVLRVAGRLQESRTAVEEAIALYDEKGNISGAARLRALLAEPAMEV
jgi:hypothetical protein